MLSILFWRAALERAVKTFAQTVLALLLAGPLVGVERVDWAAMASIGATAAIVSLLTSITSLSTVGGSAPSPEPVPDPVPDPVPETAPVDAVQVPEAVKPIPYNP